MHPDQTPTAETLDRAPVVDLAWRLHQTVAQRLAGLSYLLAADSALRGDALDRCRNEVEAAMLELRDALVSINSGGAICDRVEVDTERRALLATFPALDLRWGWNYELEIEKGGLVESFLVEALRNVRRHARPTRVDVDVSHEHGVTVVEVVNNGVVTRRGATCGVGRRLLELEASLHGALVESVPRDEGRWSQRLVLSKRPSPDIAC